MPGVPRGYTTVTGVHSILFYTFIHLTGRSLTFVVIGLSVL